MKIVGLTASVGVGKSKSTKQKSRNEAEAMQWIFSVMANMDSEELCVVEEHKEELAQHVNIPDQGSCTIDYRLKISRWPKYC